MPLRQMRLQQQLATKDQAIAVAEAAVVAEEGRPSLQHQQLQR